MFEIFLTIFLLIHCHFPGPAEGPRWFLNLVTSASIQFPNSRILQNICMTAHKHCNKYVMMSNKKYFRRLVFLQWQSYRFLFMREDQIRSQWYTSVNLRRLGRYSRKNKTLPHISAGLPKQQLIFSFSMWTILTINADWKEFSK